MRSADYRAKARDMAELAKNAPEEMREGYRQLEQVWIEMAEVAEKAEKAMSADD